ncbi:hypothetical protein GQ457_07G009750 [Hibiscus cannabinus]
MANNNLSLRSLLKKEKLNGINFLNWFQNLRIILKRERKKYVIEKPVPDELTINAIELKKTYDTKPKEIYEGQVRQERYETSKALFQCKMSEASPVGAHVIKMMGYIQTLENLGFPLTDELAIDVIQQSLSDSFNPFVRNFNMNEINKTLPQLLGMLRTAKSDLKKNGSKSILMVHEGKRKRNKKVKSKGNGKSKPKRNDAMKPEEGISKDGKYFHCNKTGHLKKNYPLYLEGVKKAKSNVAPSSSIYVIYVNI